MHQSSEAIIGQGRADGRFPRHVAIIMDGNGRWARKRLLPRTAGHRQGVEALRNTVRTAIELGIDYLTIYSFSVENWTRPHDEISDLLGLLRRFIHNDVAELHASGVRIVVLGSRAGLESDIVTLLDETERLTRSNTGLKLIVAFNYGSRQEIASAARALAADAAAGRIDPASIDAGMLAERLATAGIPDPDLLIRTGGEERLSNFLLWQSAYTELVFIDDYWPDFSREIFERAIATYLLRNRRFGGVQA
ncbi:MAG: isoprenyl transferase, partial [Pseudomonadota bacterium]|nr:isoprenyl transferase [Pseudomonadota bacterium]